MESNAIFLMCISTAVKVSGKENQNELSDVLPGCCIQSGSDVQFCPSAVHLGNNHEAEVTNTQISFLWFSHKTRDTQAL